jgi:shikimate dehydrogenase
MKDVYTLEDLRDWKSVTAGESKPIRLAVFGDPVAHSASPQMHNPALQHCGIDCQYGRIHVREGELAEALELVQANQFLGVNLTIPHKTAALKLVPDIHANAARLGAINTLLIDEQGLHGFNTDGPGILRAVRSEFGVDLRDLRVMILGAGGGAGRAIAAQCALEQCDRLVLVNRTFEKAEALARELEPLFRSERLLGPIDRLLAVPWDNKVLEHELLQTDLVINASSVGMKRTDPSPLPNWVLQPHLLIYDTVYAQSRTSLLAEADQVGARGANGLSLLLHQGALAFEIWFDQTAPLDVMRAGLLGKS